MAYTGKLPAHELSLDVAEPCLKHHESSLIFVEDGIRGRYYHERFLQGATLVPRNFCFVKPEGNPASPAVVTDDDVNKAAKSPYKGQFLRGVVHDDYLYATLLSKHLIPFGIEQLHLTALPFKVNDEGKLQAITDETDYLYAGHRESGEWFKNAAAMWDKLKKDNTPLSFSEQLNYRNKITSQDYKHPYKVIYNASGTNISACVIEINELSLKVHKRSAKGFVVESIAYSYDATSIEEAHYICALLNAPSINDAIKDYQPYGLMGARHIHRTPFEACGIEAFDPTNADHQALASLSKSAHAEVDLLIESGLSGQIAKKRAIARDKTAKILQEIDKIAIRIVEM